MTVRVATARLARIPRVSPIAGMVGQSDASWLAKLTRLCAVGSDLQSNDGATDAR